MFTVKCRVSGIPNGVVDIATFDSIGDVEGHVLARIRKASHFMFNRRPLPKALSDFAKGRGSDPEHGHTILFATLQSRYKPICFVVDIIEGKGN